MAVADKVDVSVIIINYNTFQLIIDCIKSILEQTNKTNIEIIVVDNASSDGSATIIKNCFPNITILENNQNIGFGKANNIGATIARGEFLFLLNSDTVLINDAIGYLLRYLREDKSTGICGGNLFTKDFKANHSYSIYYPSLFNIFIYRSRLLKLFGKAEIFNRSEKNKEVAIINGADLFIRKSLFEQLEGFDPNYFMYIEDGDLCLRAKKLGFRIQSIPSAKIIHYQGKSSTSSAKLIMEISSYIYYFKKHGSKSSVHIYKLIELIFALIKATLFIFTFNRSGKRSYFRVIKFLLKRME